VNEKEFWQITVSVIIRGPGKAKDPTDLNTRARTVHDPILKKEAQIA
jgi:hypothetical protein